MGNYLMVSRSPPAVASKNVTLEDDPSNAPERRPPVPPRDKSDDKDLQMRNVIDVHSRKYEAAERKESVVSDKDLSMNIFPWEGIVNAPCVTENCSRSILETEDSSPLPMVLVALCNYDSRADGDLSFFKGDEMTLVDNRLLGLFHRSLLFCHSAMATGGTCSTFAAASRVMSRET
jgi:hypothetical protein